MASVHSKKSKTGKNTYYVVISYQGKHKWIKAGTKKEALNLKKTIESLENSQRMEKLGLVSKDKRIDEFLQEYADYIKIRTSKNTIKRYLGVLNTFLVFLKVFHGNIRYMSQINTEIIESYQQKRLKSVELKDAADGEKHGNHKKKRLPLPQTVNYEVCILRSAFIWAYDREYIQTVPTKKVKPLKPKPKRKIRIIDEKECKLLLKTARELAKKNNRFKIYVKVFKFLLNTGLRSGELCFLTWDDVNLESGLIKIQPKDNWTPKTYEREFYLNELSLKLIKSIPRSENYIFTTDSGKQLDTDTVRRALIKIAKTAGFGDLTRVQDLRHTFNSLMQMNGVDPGTMGKILGHQDFDTTMIYTHQTQEHLKKCIEKVGI